MIDAVCRRHRLPADEAEELASPHSALKLVENDGVVLRRFEGLQQPSPPF